MLDLGESARSFLRDLGSVLDQTSVTTRDGSLLDPTRGLDEAVIRLREVASRGGRTWLIGNGGSAAIASHMSLDMWKNGKLPAAAFNDISLLTAIGNDCGFEELFAEPVRQFVTSKDLVMAISSSGRSPNILRGVDAAREVGAEVITLSAFAPDNPLRTLGDLNFYLPSMYYGHAEVGHLALIHAMLDAHMGYSTTSRDALTSPGL